MTTQQAREAAKKQAEKKYAAMLLRLRMRQIVEGK